MIARVVLAISLASLFTVAPAAAQSAAAAPAMHVTPYAGYLGSGKYLQGPLGTSISGSGGSVYGAQLGVDVTPNVSVIGNVAHGRADLQVGLPFLGGFSIGSSTLWLYDAGLQIGAPAAEGRAVRVFVQGGVGAMRHEVQSSVLRTTATNFAWNAGVGADFALGQNLGVSLLLRDYVGRFDFQEATSLDVKGDLAHTFTLTGGVRLSF